MNDGNISLVSWAKEQPWWSAAMPLLELGLVVCMHVHALPPNGKAKLLYKPTGATLHLVICEMAHWHITLAVSPEGLDDIQRQSQQSTATPAHGWAATTGEA